MKTKTLFFTVCIFLFSLNCGANDFQSLFEKYQQNDTEFQKAQYQLESAKLALEKTRLQNGLTFSLSTGDISASFSKDDTVLSFSPEANISVKKWNNTSLSIEAPYSVSATNPADMNNLDDASLLFSTDIFSSNSKESKLEIEKAERNVTEYKRNLLKKTVEIHMEFLEALKNLYAESQEIYEAENDLLDEQEEFRTIQAQGYASSSSKYRTAKLEVESAQNTVKEKQMAYDADLAVFASKCSVKLEEINLDFEIPQVQLINFSSLKEENFSELESARWDLYINKKEYAIDTTKSLSAQAGYGISTTTSGGETSVENVIKAGTTLNLDGFTLSALASIPLSNESSTTVTMSLAWDPFSKKENDITKKVNSISSKIDQLALLDAQETYRTSKAEKDQTRTKLDWQLTQYEEEADLYAELEKDNNQMFENGLIAESEYREAKINAANARAKLAQTKIERILYNDETVKLFIPSESDKEKERKK
ncbi:MAG: hypothetical protein K5839_04420 [Treponemataceae bacterium]|nr:hypothetical protein [Treponemataceae bacterium]